MEHLQTTLTKYKRRPVICLLVFFCRDGGGGGGWGGKGEGPPRRLLNPLTDSGNVKISVKVAGFACE